MTAKMCGQYFRTFFHTNLSLKDFYITQVLTQSVGNHFPNILDANQIENGFSFCIFALQPLFLKHLSCLKQTIPPLTNCDYNQMFAR